MKMPKKLQNFTAIVNGIQKAGTIKELSIPELEVKTEDYQSGGMDIGVPLEGGGMEAIVVGLTFSEIDPQIIRLFGFRGDGPVQVQAIGAGKYHNNWASYEITMWGVLSKVGFGDWSAGNSNQSVPATIKCSYFQVKIDGRVEIEIDGVNLKRVIDGEDQLLINRTILKI